MTPAVRTPTRARLYAELPRRQFFQVLADLLVVVWVVLMGVAANALYDAVLTLQDAGRGLVQAGGQVRDVFEGASGAAGGLPFIGSTLAEALGAGTNAGQTIVDAGYTEIQAVGATATGLAWMLLALAVAPVLVVWLVVRLRWVKKARHALVARAGNVDLLALRALVRSSPRRLRRMGHDDPTGAWRRGERDATMRLAELELNRLGLRGPQSLALQRPEPGRDRVQ